MTIKRLKMYRYEYYKRNRYNNKPAISKEDIIDLYINRGMSFEQLMVVCKLTRPKMIKYLSENGISKAAANDKKDVEKYLRFKEDTPEKMFDEFINYLKYTFGTNMKLKQLCEDEYLINNRWKFKWVKGWEKDTKIIVDIMGELDDIVTIYSIWKYYKPSKYDFILQYDMNNNFIRAYDRLGEVVKYNPFYKSEIIDYAVRRAEFKEAYGYLWAKSDNVNV